MLVHARFRLPLTFLMALGFAVCLPLQAQINGVPASVTSLGFGGRSTAAPGVRASVTSLGPNGFGNNWAFLGGCCSSYFVPAYGNRGASSGRRHRRANHSDFPVGVVEPVYIPYAIPYAPESEDDPADDDASVPYADAGPRNYDRGNIDRANINPANIDPANFDHAPGRARVRDSAATTANLVEQQAPVTAQPSTVLVFKDGRHSDILNYAIVGNTLFDFSTERTRKIQLADIDLEATQKANDDRGVGFEVPALQ